VPTASNEKLRMIINNELKKMWKVAVMAYFKILFQHLPIRTKIITHNNQLKTKYI